MAKLGALSISRLATCHPDLIRLVRAYEQIATHDFSVACGHRGRSDQDDAFARGASKLKWPHSKHNTYPALAVDLWPYPVDWSPAGVPAFERQRREVLTLAHDLGIAIHVISWDLPHFQLA